MPRPRELPELPEFRERLESRDAVPVNERGRDELLWCPAPMLNIGAFCCLHTIDGVRVPSPALLALACADVDAVTSAAAVTEIAGVEEDPIDTVAEAAAEAPSAVFVDIVSYSQLLLRVDSIWGGKFVPQGGICHHVCGWSRDDSSVVDNCL